MQPLAIAVLVFAFVVLAAGIAFFVRATQAHAIASAERLRLDSEREALSREAEALNKETLLAAREEAHSLRETAEREARDIRALAQRSQETAEERALQREQALEHRARTVAELESALRGREVELTSLREEIETLRERQIAELERLGGLTQEEARTQFLRRLEEDHRLEAARLVRQIEEEARQDGARKAREIVVQAIQRCAVSQVSETTVSVVPLPSDEMKGRIIGREGRNIRTFETLSGVDVIIDDTPEAVVLSAFDPVRREIARVALTSLVEDGRIHPSRIEEAIARAEDEIESRIREAGESAAVRAGVGGLHEDLVRVLGKLRFRTSYGQNVLDHSVEVAQLSAAMAAELGVNVEVSRRGGLLHDVGKAENLNGEGSHLDHSVELARKYGEAPEVVHAIAAHHGDVEFGSVEAVLVQVADAISASRPGARREMLETYIKRMQKLENVVSGIKGVERSFAVQAGRELRIIVSPSEVDDLTASQLARETAKKIEEECEYPGQIKVTVIRETRASEYAR